MSCASVPPTELRRRKLTKTCDWLNNKIGRLIGEEVFRVGLLYKLFPSKALLFTIFSSKIGR